MRICFVRVLMSFVPTTKVDRPRLNLYDVVFDFGFGLGIILLRLPFLPFVTNVLSKLFYVDILTRSFINAGTCLGILAKDGVLLAAERKNTHKLLDEVKIVINALF